MVGAREKQRPAQQSASLSLHSIFTLRLSRETSTHVSRAPGRAVTTPVRGSAHQLRPLVGRKDAADRDQSFPGPSGVSLTLTARASCLAGVVDAAREPHHTVSSSYPLLGARASSGCRPIPLDGDDVAGGGATVSPAVGLCHAEGAGQSW